VLIDTSEKHTDSVFGVLNENSWNTDVRVYRMKSIRLEDVIEMKLEKFKVNLKFD
jgi:hypothetical protein